MRLWRWGLGRRLVIDGSISKSAMLVANRSCRPRREFTTLHEIREKVRHWISGPTVDRCPQSLNKSIKTKPERWI